MQHLHSVHLQRGGELSLQLNFQKGGGLTGPQVLEGGCWDRGRCIFSGRGDYNFHIKNKITNCLELNFTLQVYYNFLII